MNGTNVSIDAWVGMTFLYEYDIGMIEPTLVSGCDR